MNVSVVGGGIVLLVMGGVVFGMAYNRVSELQSFVGQLARSMSPSLQNEYMMISCMKFFLDLWQWRFLSCHSWGRNERETLTGSSIASPSRPAPITTFPQTYCHMCGALLSEEDWYCRKCGAVVPAH